MGLPVLLATAGCGRILCGADLGGGRMNQIADQMVAEREREKFRTRIHPTATIQGDVAFDDDTTIGPYCTIGS